MLRVSKPCSMPRDRCLTLTLLRTLTLQSGLQKRIHSELVTKRRSAAMASLPTGEPRNGLWILRPLTTDESASRRQGIISMTCYEAANGLMRTIQAPKHASTHGLSHQLRPDMPTSSRSQPLVTAMLAKIFAISLSHVGLSGNTTLLTANHSWITTYITSMSQRSTQTKLIVERILC